MRQQREVQRSKNVARRRAWTLIPVAALIVLFSCLGFPLHAQQQPPPEFSNPPPSPPASIPADPDVASQPGGEQTIPDDPYWQETVEKAVEQFQSKNPEVRRSAVMLLGKYPVPPALQVIGEALEDPDAKVRQAALVSVLEEQGQVNPAFTSKLLRLLADPDVSIRRIASNSIQAIIFTSPFVMQPGAVQMQRQLPEETNEILREAFRDEDVSVRRNMVTHYPLLRLDLPEETVLSLLHDPDTEVAVRTLRWAFQLLGSQTLSREVEALSQHENPVFRLELARALQSHRSPATLTALEALQDDSDAAVALEAMLATFHHRQSVELYERIVERYRETGGRSDAGQRIIFAAQLLGDRGEPYLRQWMEDGNPSLRQQAAQVYLSRYGGKAEMDFLLSLLSDSAPGVRQQAVQALMTSNDRLKPEYIEQAASSRHVDVRRAAAGLTSFLPVNQVEDILLDLLLDDAGEVQLAALHQIGQRQLSGWEEIMSISLRVDDPKIQRTALDWLMRQPSPETLDLIRAYREENPGSPLRPQIELHLKRHQTADPS